MAKRRKKAGGSGPAAPAEDAHPAPEGALAGARVTRSGIVYEEIPKKRRQEPKITGPVSAIASFPTELLHIVFEEVVRPCKDATERLRALTLLGDDCQAWQACVATVPVPSMNVTNLRQAQRLVALFGEGGLAAHSLRSLAMSAKPLVVRRGKRKTSSDLKLSTLCAAILALCINVTELSITVDNNHLAAQSALADDFLQSPALSKLQKLAITLRDSLASQPGALKPLLMACPGLVDLSISGRYERQRTPLGSKPSYSLTTLRYQSYGWGSSDDDLFLAFAVGQTRRLGSLRVDDEQRAQEVLRLPETWDSLQEIDTLPPPGRILTNLKRCVVRRGMYATDFHRIPSSPATELHVTAHVAVHSLIYGHPGPSFRLSIQSGRLDSIKVIRVEYIPKLHYGYLDRLELIEDACIARGIEFDLIPEL